MHGERPNRRPDGLVNAMHKNFIRRTSPAVLFIALLGISLTACADEQSVQGQIGSAAPNTSASPSPTSDICYLTDLTAIAEHARTANITAAPQLPAQVREEFVKSSDASSFVTRTTAADLTAAGINTSTIPSSTPLILIVNHGEWPQVGTGPAGFPDGSSPQSTPTPTPEVNWLVYALNASTYKLILFTAAPAGPCFKG